MMTIIVKKIETLILRSFFLSATDNIDLKNPINLIWNMKLIDTVVIEVLLLVFCSPGIGSEFSAISLSKLLYAQSGECIRRLQTLIRQPAIAD